MTNTRIVDVNPINNQKAPLIAERGFFPINLPSTSLYHPSVNNSVSVMGLRKANCPSNMSKTKS